MENIPKQVVFADLWPHPTNKQVLITRNSILLDYSSIVRNVGKVLMNESANSFLEQEKLGKLMGKYAVPCIISLLVAALYNIVDQM